MKKLKVCSRITPAFVIMSILMMLFTGCSKEPVTTDAFKALSSEKGLVINDVGEQFSDFDYIKEAAIAAPSDLSYQIEFYVLSDSSYAQSFFENNKAKFEMSKIDGFLENSGSGNNYVSYSLTSGEKYMFIERIENTVIYVNTNKTNKEVIDSFIKELKY